MVSFTTPHYISIIFDFMRGIVLLILDTMCMASKGGMSLFPTYFTLGTLGFILVL